MAGPPPAAVGVHCHPGRHQGDAGSLALNIAVDSGRSPLPVKARRGDSMPMKQPRVMNAAKIGHHLLPGVAMDPEISGEKGQQPVKGPAHAVLRVGLKKRRG
jgi:hypothetical protein